MSTYHIVGQLVSLVTKPNPYNFNRTTVTKMTVQDKDGTRYHGTRPVSLRNAEIGDKVKFKAEISRSPNVPRFFFFQRPRMAHIS
jgi:hypothetical protein